MKEAIISAKDLSFRYEGKESYAVDHVNIEIEKGSFVAVLGRNGSGKSTFAKLLNVLIEPTEGEISVCSLQPKTEDDAFAIRQKCGMVFQNPDNQMVATIVEEDVAFGCENLGVAPGEIVRRVDWSLRTVGMEEYRKAAPHMLSGGQKQRIAIAGVIAMLPEVIVFDESTSMLDPSGRQDIFDLAMRLNKENNVTVLWITHFMEEAAKCDRVIVMDQGRVKMDGTAREVFSDPKKIEKFGLEAPDMAKLAEALRKEGLDLKDGIITVDEMEVELCRLLSKI
ncbi:MAG: energy-coupling factor transporter ATPase [Clostridia bacterium]|nr:energy-coupling factor transporter ATPase [Clostridia bacterium]